MLLSSLSVCKNVLGSDLSRQHCAPSEPSILQQLEEVVVMPNYHRLFPGGARKLFNIFGSSYCDEAAKRLACWVSYNSHFLLENLLSSFNLLFSSFILFYLFLYFANWCTHMWPSIFDKIMYLFFFIGFECVITCLMQISSSDVNVPFYNAGIMNDETSILDWIC